MYIRRVEHTLNDILNSRPIPNDSFSYSNTSNGGGNNGLLNFGVALGGILIVTIITGIITYLYRKKLNCKQKVSSSGSKESDHINSIMDYYSNDYIVEMDNNNDNPNNNNRNDAPGSVITNDTTIKTNKSEYNLMNAIKNIGAKSSDKTSNENSSDKTKNRSKSVTLENRSRSDTIKENRTKSMKYVKRSSSNEKIEYIVPQISSPVSMPSASIYDIERASSLADSLSRSTAFQVQTPPIPPIPIRSSIIDKQPKDVESSSDSRQKFSSKFSSFYNLIPFIFMDSETETNTNVGPSVPPKTTSITTTSSAGVIPDWSKAPWNDPTFYKNNNDNNNNNNNNDNDNDNDDSNNNDNNDIDSLNSSRYSQDLIRFSNGSKYSKNRRNSQYRIDQQIRPLKSDSNTNDNPESSESKSQEYNRDDFIKELKINIDKDPEKYEFLKNPAENHHNWKRNGNFFEYRLQRSKTII